MAAADDGIRFGVQLVLGEGGIAALPESGRLVEALGFDGLFVFDHPALQADPWIALAGLAAVTERVRLGSVVTCVAYRHPAQVSRFAADLDRLSHGRLMLGLGIGWLKPEFLAFGVPFDSVKARYAALEEALRIVQGGWGPDPFSFAGEHYRVDELRIVPPPVQSPRPPLMIGGSGEEATLRLVARHADACNITDVERAADGTASVGGPDTVRRKLARLRAHCEAEGRLYDEILRSHFTLKVAIAPTEAAVADKLNAAAKRASTSPGTRRADPSAFVTGTPEQVAARYRTLVDAGIQYFVVQIDQDDRETIELLAAEVAPRVG